MQYWEHLFLVATLIWSVSTAPMPYDPDSTLSRLENDILSQSELTTRLRRADNSVVLAAEADNSSISGNNPESFTGRTTDDTQPAESRQVSSTVD